MKYYSETLKRIYDTEDELLKAEDAFKKEQIEKEEKRKAKEAERAKKLAEKVNRWNEVDSAIKNATKLYNEYCKDYGIRDTNEDWMKLFLDFLF